MFPLFTCFYISNFNVIELTFSCFSTKQAKQTGPKKSHTAAYIANPSAVRNLIAVEWQRGSSCHTSLLSVTKARQKSDHTSVEAEGLI